jgi:Heparinase II/III N-terminus/Heparinase II/III-like protein
LRLGEIFETITEYGPGWAFWRSGWEVMLRTGLMERLLPPLESLPSGSSPRLPVITSFAQRETAGHEKTEKNSGAEAIAAADEILNGVYRYWSGQTYDLGLPPNWFYSPETNREWPKEPHWSRIPELGGELGDVKYIWELARFRFAFPLARAYRLTGDNRYAEAFWVLFEDWAQANRAERGPHWRCGQEMSFRVFAWLFSASVFHQAPASTEARLEALGAQVCYHATHIEKVHWYARRCVRNNHAISEAVCLLTVGVCFKDHLRSERWQQMGLAALNDELKWQLSPDGGYVQQSMNYARLVAQLLTWVLALAETHQLSLPNAIFTGGRALLDYLVAFQDSSSGGISNFGLNDGTLLFPLSDCEYGDFRPALNGLSVLLGRGRLYDTGPWDEEAFWFSPQPDAAAVDSTISQSGSDENRHIVFYESADESCQVFSSSGYLSLKSTNSQGLFRCGPTRHRPHEADMLHLDLWFYGVNLLIDPGTFSYNPPAGWRAYFSGSGAHNLVTRAGEDQMRRGDRFMWHRWTQGDWSATASDSSGIEVTGWCKNYHNDIHRRSVQLHRDRYLIKDEFICAPGAGDQKVRLHWLLPDGDLERTESGGLFRVPGGGDHSIQIRCGANVPGKGEWVKGDSGIPRGWQAPVYGKLKEAWSYSLEVESGHVVFYTLIGPPDVVTEDWPLIESKTVR